MALCTPGASFFTCLPTSWGWWRTRTEADRRRRASKSEAESEAQRQSRQLAAKRLQYEGWVAEVTQQAKRLGQQWAKTGRVDAELEKSIKHKLNLRKQYIREIQNIDQQIETLGSATLSFDSAKMMRETARVLKGSTAQAKRDMGSFDADDAKDAVHDAADFREDAAELADAFDMASAALSHADVAADEEELQQFLAGVISAEQLGTSASPAAASSSSTPAVLTTPPLRTDATHFPPVPGVPIPSPAQAHRPGSSRGGGGGPPTGGASPVLAD